MTSKRNLIVAVLVTFCLTAMLFSVIPTYSTMKYDPWVDYDENGKIDGKDIAAISKAFDTQGNPTKDVVVENMPVCNSTTIWFRTPLNSTWITSSTYDSCGFGHLHILLNVACLAQDANATVILYSNIWDGNHVNRIAINVWSITYTIQNIPHSTAVTIPVPGQEFYFFAYTTPVVNNAQISLSFYLTWS